MEEKETFETFKQRFSERYLENRVKKTKLGSECVGRETKAERFSRRLLGQSCEISQIGRIDGGRQYESSICSWVAVSH